MAFLELLDKNAAYFLLPVSEAPSRKLRGTHLRFLAGLRLLLYSRAEVLGLLLSKYF